MNIVAILLISYSFNRGFVGSDVLLWIVVFVLSFLSLGYWTIKSEDWPMSYYWEIQGWWTIVTVVIVILTALGMVFTLSV